MAYLNTQTVDDWFRQFNGHTQVNATDVRSLVYPDRDALIEWLELKMQLYRLSSCFTLRFQKSLCVRQLPVKTRVVIDVSTDTYGFNGDGAVLCS